MATFFENVARWNWLKQQIAAMKAEEALLRDALMGGCFPEAKEGVNTLVFPEGTDEIPPGSKLKGTKKITRRILRAEFDKMSKPEQDKLIKMGVVLMDPTLVLSVYRSLEDKKLVERCMEIKPGMPELELILATKPE